MKNKYALVVFDMAGTTINEDNLVYKLIHQIIIDDGYDCSIDLVLSIAAGKEKRSAFRDILIELGVFAPDKLADRLHELFKEKLLIAYATAPILPMEGAGEVFAVLKSRGIKVVLNTGYDSATAHHLIQRLYWNIGEEIDGLITASDVHNGRPAPDMILLAMQKMEISDARLVVKVGDSIIDIVEGKNAKCGLTIGITTGAQNASLLQLSNPDYIIDSLNEIISLIE